MNSAKSGFIIAAFSFIPYLLVSWGYMEIENGGSREFWSCFLVLLGVRAFFSVIETLGSVLMWRLYGRRLTISKLLEFLRSNQFPAREQDDTDFLHYIDRLADAHGPLTELKATAKEMRAVVVGYETMGILAGMRMHAASDAALDLYSPRG